jgi:hypothetical protein
MIRSTILCCLIAAAPLACVTQSEPRAPAAPALARAPDFSAALASPVRTEREQHRDTYHHPAPRWASPRKGARL